MTIKIYNNRIIWVDLIKIIATIIGNVPIENGLT